MTDVPQAQAVQDALECDIVMKGGITSGVVYPAAIVELAKTFRFRDIGGTSAGAIAAVVTAAAEYGRQAGTGTAFAGLAKLPGWLAANGHLLGLFRPNRRTRPLFALLMRVLDSPAGQNKLFAAIGAVLTWNWTMTLLTAIPGVIVAVAGLYAGRFGLTAFGIALAVVLPLAISLWTLFQVLANVVPANLYGICTGLEDLDADEPTVLTSWLTQTIDGLAGVTYRLAPLTFGDLWTAGRPAAAAVAAAAAPQPEAKQDAYTRDRQRKARQINLETITTNLSHGRPYRFPFDTNTFYFDPDEFGKLFPPRVVKHMLATSRKGADDEEKARMQAALPLTPLPEAADLPVVVAARMSLSFPLLISAVPLWAVDWGNPANAANRTHPQFERCWFSDGGLSSNFPIHLFDGPIPTRPTFAIDLDSFPIGYSENANECDNVWMPQTNYAGTQEIWTRFGQAPDGSQKPDLGGFAGAILNAVQNWQDNTLSHVPGFRDRIVHVYLNADEGGINLNMPSALLTKLADRGTCAGQLLATQYAKPNPPACGAGVTQPTNWDNHRIVRYRNAMALLEHWMRGFCDAYTPAYQALTGRALGTPPCSYAWANDDQRSYAISATGDLCAMNQHWMQSGQSFAAGAPKPQPELVQRPRV